MLAAWFPDPDDPDCERWWDGERWADERREATPTIDLAPNSNWAATSRLTFGTTAPDVPSRLAFAVIVAGVAIIAGTQLSWLRAESFNVVLNIRTRGPWLVGNIADTLWVLLTGLAVAVSGAMMWWSRWRGGVVLVIGCSALSFGLALASLLHVQHYFRAHHSYLGAQLLTVAPSTGMDVVFASSVGAAACAILSWYTSRTRP